MFVSLNDSNEILIKQIENGIDNIQIIYPEGIKPTRKNVLDNKYLNLIVGGVNMFASNPIPNYTQDVDNIVDAYTNLEYVDVPAETLISILKKTGSAEQTDFDRKKYISCIKALQEKPPTIKSRIIHRDIRDISKGTGSSVRPSDRKLGDKFNDDITLTIYRVNGSTDKGWDGMPNWIPNIKFPDGICFYDIVE